MVLNQITSTIQYPAGHRHTWVGTWKRMAHKQARVLHRLKVLALVFVLPHIPVEWGTPGFDSGQSSSYWCSNSILSNYSTFPLPAYSHYAPLFFTFLLLLFTNLICFYDFESAADSHKANNFESLFSLNSNGSSSKDV